MAAGKGCLSGGFGGNEKGVRERMNPISEDTLKDVCKIGQGKECCRYLACGPNGFDCMKHSSIGRVLDSRVAAGTIRAQGDNCEGRR